MFSWIFIVDMNSYYVNILVELYVNDYFNRVYFLNDYLWYTLV